VAFKLCIADKPSVGRDIARVMGATIRHDGYYEGEGYLVTWVIGHLISFAEPEDYGYISKAECFGEGKKKTFDELPLTPEEFKFNVIGSTESQFNIVRQLMLMPEVELIIDCGDMSAEGHVWQWFIRDYIGCNKRVFRFCATSMTDEAIRKTMGNLKPIEKFENIIRGELCKKKADWILGVSMSRALSIKYMAGINVDRVQLPTLYFIVKRFLDAQHFKVNDYYVMSAELIEGVKVYWNKDTNGCFPVPSKDDEGHVLDKARVDNACAKICMIKKGVVSDITRKKKVMERPRLYDITELQRQANILYGYSAVTTLATAQSLYDTHKLLSYPRTDSRYITTDLSVYLKPFVEALSTIARYSDVAKSLIAEGVNIDKRIVDDSKVVDCHALIPTNNFFMYDGRHLVPIGDDAKNGVTANSLNNILDLILCRLLVSLSKPYIFENVVIKVLFDNRFVFSASSNIPLSMGWRARQDALLGKYALNSDVSDDMRTLPNIAIGQEVTLDYCEVIAKKTIPPMLHTEATLLTAMENAGVYRNTENGQILKGVGIGAQATRAEIISQLFNSGVVEGEKQNNIMFIKPTPKGVGIIRVAPPDLYSPQITAGRENMIADIAKGIKTDVDFMNEFIPFIKKKVKEVETVETGVVFKREREVHGVCPWCKKDLYLYEKKDPRSKKLIDASISCVEECGFLLSTLHTVFLTHTKKPITVVELKKLASEGVLLLDCPSDEGCARKRRKFTFYKIVTSFGRTRCNVKVEFIN